MWLWWWSLLFFINIHGYQSQQSYIDKNQQLDSSIIDSNSFGYTCNHKTSIPTCLSYITFRSQPPLYNIPFTIAALLNTNPNYITAINNYPNDINATIEANNIVIVPIHNCSCSHGGYYQYNASYVLKTTYENYYTVSNDTYGGLTEPKGINTSPAPPPPSAPPMILLPPDALVIRSRKQKYQCGKEEETPATITTNIKHALNDDKLDEYYYEMEAEEQKQWMLKSKREARLEAARKRREEHWKELEAIRKLEEEYEEHPELEKEDEDNEYESFDYDDLHLAYSGEKTPKYVS
nr:protein LYK5 [Tanacetum cinerariifolium]